MPQLSMKKRSENHKSLSTRQICKAQVPEAKGKRCMDARFGWIIAVAPHGGDIYLFNPFSSSRIIELPNFHNFPRYHKNRCHPNARFARKAILSANPSETSKFTVFVLMNSGLGFWKNGDKNWDRIEPEIPKCVFRNIGYCGHEMYAIDTDWCVWSWDPSATDITQLQLVQTFEVPSRCQTVPYIVESTTGKLIVLTWNDGKRSLGNDAICIGQNAAVCVAADDYPGVIEPNCIYLATEQGPKNKGCEKEVRIYDFERRRIERFPH